MGRHKKGEPNWIQKFIKLSPWLIATIQHVQARETERTGKQQTFANTVRGLLQLGVDEHRRLGRLPQIQR